MEKIDLRKQLKPFYQASAKVVGEVLHVGPFSTEGPTIERLHAHVATRSALRGRHHEIYLSDIRRADPSRWKTILRQPME